MNRGYNAGGLGDNASFLDLKIVSIEKRIIFEVGYNVAKEDVEKNAAKDRALRDTATVGGDWRGRIAQTCEVLAVRKPAVDETDHSIRKAQFYHFIDEAIAPNTVVRFFDVKVDAKSKIISIQVRAIPLNDSREVY